METLKAKPDVSIIICTYSRAALLRDTLLSLENLSSIRDAEVVVVDNNSPDDTAIVVAECIALLKGKVRVKYIFEPKQGLSVARNRGVQESAGAYLAFLDDDAIPSTEWLSHIRDAFARHPKAGAIGGIIRPNFETGRPDWLVKQLELGFTIVDFGNKERKYPRRFHPYGANMAIRREVFDGLLFPESLGRKGKSLLSGEESWLFAQMRKKGSQLVYVPGMSVIHFIPDDRLRQEWIKRRFYFQGVSHAVWGDRFPLRIKLLCILLLKRIYLLVNSMFIQTPGQRLLKECRLESIRGSVDTLRSRGAIVDL
ncbi:glycosyltransferase [Cohnella cholangitidis]|uniref:Glycosyltransferase family 2 protein n=1 Tax=Cohnella cholangitidis TaxID=2598458 RepID=A0A7G5C1Z0_9BACL|nr:glycosyltransferase [Cohnella cholangitidis]QMV43224.1 glycosyltransferase family 2 protein [Cohnella cholangitidis]